MKPSLYKQAEAYPVPAPPLRASPRHWNPGLLKYRDKLWLAYRFHRREAKQRCGIAICALDPDRKFEPSESSQFLRFTGITGTEHHEDCRLFMFRGEPHISYTEMRGYRPGIDYTCVVKYARLSLDGKGRWHVEEEFHPQYGLNSGFAKEKNWVFFEHDGKLMCIYSSQPEHVVFQIEGEKVVGEKHVSPAPIWHWGAMRGGTPPIPLDKDRMMLVFHSSLATETAPHYVRYYAGAYAFEAKPPFRILEVSETPIMAGSEEDGHQVDPRYVDGWKPYVVFPCGLVPDNGKFLVSLGVNDWQCAVARFSLEQMRLGAADGTTFKPRYFKVRNGTIPVKYIDQSGRIQFLQWKVFRPGRNGMAGEGYLCLTSARDASEAMEHHGAQEITESEYLQAEACRKV